MTLHLPSLTHFIEWTFGYCDGDGTGVFSMAPKEAPPAVYRETLFIGMCTLTNTQIYSKIHKLENAFPGSSYNLFTNNCVTFCDVMCYELTHRRIPSWVNRLATLADKFSCLLPESLREEAQRGNRNDDDTEVGRLLRPPTAATMQVPTNDLPRKHTPFSGTGYRLSDSAPFPPPSSSSPSSTSSSSSSSQSSRSSFLG